MFTFAAIRYFSIHGKAIPATQSGTSTNSQTNDYTI